jgi:hypothetical protein
MLYGEAGVSNSSPADSTGGKMGWDTNELDTRYEDKLRTERREEEPMEDDDDEVYDDSE